MVLPQKTSIHVQPKRTRRKRIHWANVLKKLLFWIAFFVFLGTTVWALFFSSLMRINSINITNQRIDKNELSRVIAQELNGMYLTYIPKDNLLVASKKNIKATLLRQFRLIKKVTIQRVFPNALLINIEERESTLAWCVAGECFLVDENGEAFFALAADDSELMGGGLVRIDDQSPNRIAVGRHIVLPEVARLCQQFPDAVAQVLGIEPNRVMSTPSPMANEMRMKTNAGWDLLWNTSIPLDQQLALLKQVIEQQLKPEQVAQLEYLDIRLKGKVIYRLKQQPQEEISEKEQNDSNSDRTKTDEKSTKLPEDDNQKPDQG